MLTNFFNHIGKIYPISGELKEDLESLLEVVEVDKGEQILREGQRSDHIYIVLKGLLRSYYIKDGMEICSRFMQEEHIVISVGSFYARKAGYEYIEATEPSVLGRIHYNELQKIYAKHIEFNYIARVLTEHYFSLSEERLYLLRKQSAEERYLFFLQNYPDLLMRVPLKHIATFLGMSLETLSRIRKKISERTI